MRPAAEAGFIYDIGYQRYEGARLGRGYAFRSLFTHSLRQAWGLGRGGRTLVVPLGIFAIILLPALLQVLLDTVSNGQAKLLGYADYFTYVQMMVVLFCAAQAPELVSTDQQNRVLPLYFSRALRRTDYAAAKLLAMVAALWILVLVPMAVLFLGRISAAADVGAALRVERASLVPVLASTLAVAAVMGSISVALASFTARRGLASASIFGMVVLTTAVSAILRETVGGPGAYATLLSPLRVLGGVIRRLFKVPEPTPRGAAVVAEVLTATHYGAAALALVALAVSALFLRYRRVSA
jgi:ABC-2 type transport system permease protein